jgi:hypothetical protein
MLISCDYAAGFRIRRIRLNGTVETVAGNGVVGYTDGIGTAASLSPYQTIFNRNGTTLYVSNFLSLRAISMTAADGLYRVTTLTGSSVAGYQDGSAASARFRNIGFLSLSANDQYLYFSDSLSNRRVRRLDLINRVVTTIAVTGLTAAC